MCGLITQRGKTDIALRRQLKAVQQDGADPLRKIKVGAVGSVITKNNAVKDMAFGYNIIDGIKGERYMFNARAEGFNNKDNELDYAGKLGILSNPWSKAGIQNNRVVIPVVDFVEGPEKERLKKPYEVKLDGYEDFYLGAFAGIDSKKGYEGFCIVTCWPNVQIKDIIGHHRSPVILTPADAEIWLDPETAIEEVLGLMKPYQGLMNIKPLFIPELF